MKKKILNDVIRLAIKELPTHPEYNHYCHWSFIIQNNKIVEWSTNDNGIPPIHLGYNSRIDCSEPKRHAEFNAWRKAKGILIQNKSFECINIRLNRLGEIKFSAPCICCSNFLKALGCNKVYFTTDLGWAKVNL